MSKSYLVKVVLPVLTILAGFAAIILYEPLRERMFYSTSQIDFSEPDFAQILNSVNTSGRGVLWASAMEFFHDMSPIFGAGAGSVDGWLRHYSSAKALHSEYLRIYIDFGTIGLALYVGAILEIFAKMARASKHSLSENSEANKYRALGISLIIFYAITMLTDNTFNYVFDLALHTFFAVAAANYFQSYSGSVAKADSQENVGQRGFQAKTKFNVV